MKFDLSGRAERDVERIGAWWQKHRDVGSELFFEELEEAEKHLKANPASGQPWRRRKGHLIRRWQLERTHYHIYYMHRADDELGLCPPRTEAVDVNERQLRRKSGQAPGLFSI